MIDAHVHLWRLGRNGCTWPTAALPAIHRDFTLSDWRAASAGEDARALLVQSQEDEADTRWLLDVAAAEPAVAGVVGWTDLLAPGAPGRVAALAAEPLLAGLRPMVQDRADDWYDLPALQPGLGAMAAGELALDALVRPRHLPALRRLAAANPALTIVVDHAGKPDPDDLSGWAREMAALATGRNVWCKLSGLLTELAPSRPAGAIAPVVDAALHAFGPERLIWGSDWPVLLLAGQYEDWLAQARDLVPAAHHSAVFGGNARRAYRLDRR